MIVLLDEESINSLMIVIHLIHGMEVSVFCEMRIVDEHHQREISMFYDHQHIHMDIHQVHGQEWVIQRLQEHVSIDVIQKHDILGMEVIVQSRQ